MDSRFSSKSSAHSAAMLPTINGLNGDGGELVHVERMGRGYRLKRNEAWISIWMFPKIMVPQIIHFNRVFHYKPSILGYPYFRKPPSKSTGGIGMFIFSASEWSRDSQEAQYLLLPLAAEGSLACFLALLGGLVAWCCFSNTSVKT